MKCFLTHELRLVATLAVAIAGIGAFACIGASHAKSFARASQLGSSHGSTQTYGHAACGGGRLVPVTRCA